MVIKTITEIPKLWLDAATRNHPANNNLTTPCVHEKKTNMSADFQADGTKSQATNLNMNSQIAII